MSRPRLTIAITAMALMAIACSGRQQQWETARRADTLEAYQQFLHRGADQGGLDAWVAFLQQGHTVEQMEAGIISSPEYFQVRGGGTNAGFLAALY